MQPAASGVVRLIGILHGAADQESLRQIASQFGWNVLITEVFADGMALIEHQSIPIVICDRELTGMDWKQSLARIASCSPCTCILLASRVADPYLWDEVIRHHGYDIVRKPFDAEELRRIVRFASTWREWMRAYQNRTAGGPSS